MKEKHSAFLQRTLKNKGWPEKCDTKQSPTGGCISQSFKTRLPVACKFPSECAVTAH